MKVIDLNKRTIYVDDIEQIYRETNYIPERYNVQTTYGTYLIDQEDYYKVRDYLLSLNDEVEILEEEKKITPTDFENLGYALGSIQKYINKGYDKAIEEKKIPEKLNIEQDGQTYNNFYIVNQNGTKCYLTKHSKMIVETLNQVIDYLDYLKSKGDE